MKYGKKYKKKQQSKPTLAVDARESLLASTPILAVFVSTSSAILTRVGQAREVVFSNTEMTACYIDVVTCTI